MRRLLIAIAVISLSLPLLAKPKNAYFTSATQPSFDGKCVRLKKVGARYLWHCVYEPIQPGQCIPPTTSGPKKFEELTDQEKTDQGFRGHNEDDVAPSYKKANGSVGHQFSGVDAYKNDADRSAKKPVYRKGK